MAMSGSSGNSNDPLRDEDGENSGRKVRFVIDMAMFGLQVTESLDEDFQISHRAIYRLVFERACLIPRLAQVLSNESSILLDDAQRLLHEIENTYQAQSNVHGGEEEYFGDELMDHQPLSNADNYGSISLPELQGAQVPNSHVPSLNGSPNAATSEDRQVDRNEDYMNDNELSGQSTEEE